MRVRDFIAKVLLWAYIRALGLQRVLGGVGHSFHICGLAPWEPPDRGPWEGVCSPRVCPEYDECLKMVVHWTHAQEVVNDLRLELDEGEVEN